MNEFFKGFNFDTLLALISCIASVVALFLSGTAYKEYHNSDRINKSKKSFNDKKRFGDGGTDNSQKAGGDIINNNCDTNAIVELASANFATSLNKAYQSFEMQTMRNMEEIICKTEKIIRENNLNLGNYTKIDWINIYFESAKNAGDTYMQDVWAKLLAKELEVPGTFSYKTLDVLKNMSKDDFIIFEKMCSLQIDGAIIQGHAFTNHGLEWLDYIKMCELGLISLDNTDRTIKLLAKSEYTVCSNTKNKMIFSNNTENIQEITYSVFILTYAAKELLNIVTYEYSDDFLQDVIEDIKKNNSKIIIELQNVVTVEVIN